MEEIVRQVGYLPEWSDSTADPIHPSGIEYFHLQSECNTEKKSLECYTNANWQEAKTCRNQVSCSKFWI
jgi:hypothetical protein